MSDDNVIVPNSGNFSIKSGWMTLSRLWNEVHGEPEEVVEILPVKGVGAMLRTYSRGAGYDSTTLVPGVMVLEHITRETSAVLTAGGAPSSVTRTLVGRELVECGVVASMIPNVTNPVPGFVITVSSAPEDAPVQTTADRHP